MAIRGRIIAFNVETLEITIRISDTEKMVISIEDRSTEFSIADPPRPGEDEVFLHFGYNEEDISKPHSVVLIERIPRPKEKKMLTIECLTDEKFPPGYLRTTFRRQSPKYEALAIGDAVVLESREDISLAVVVEKTPDLTLADIENWPLPADSPYPTGQAVIEQLRKVYPDAEEARFVAFLLRAE